ncbi:MAG TPA: sigma-70 family RNA polymerase sigma factor [Pyrinomonadaceae bacterium]|nr:sigma-70 family RNA polymerase sigma factor [Pyrinomonadaceae bacterium]
MVIEQENLPAISEETGTETPDEVLVVAAILGDFTAFDELVSRYRPAVVRAAQTIVGRDDAEDVAQDALILAFKALPSIEDPLKFAAWLSTITRHRALRFTSRESAHRRGRVELDEVLLENLGSLSKPFFDEQDEELARALENVPADYAIVLKLHFLDEMPLKRIAAFLGLPLSTVKWRVHRAKKLAREQIELLRGERWKERKRFLN